MLNFSVLGLRLVVGSFLHGAYWVPNLRGVQVWRYWKRLNHVCGCLDALMVAHAERRRSTVFLVFWRSTVGGSMVVVLFGLCSLVYFVFYPLFHPDCDFFTLWACCAWVLRKVFQAWHFGCSPKEHFSTSRVWVLSCLPLRPSYSCGWESLDSFLSLSMTCSCARTSFVCMLP